MVTSAQPLDRCKPLFIQLIVSNFSSVHKSTFIKIHYSNYILNSPQFVKTSEHNYCTRKKKIEYVTLSKSPKSLVLMTLQVNNKLINIMLNILKLNFIIGCYNIDFIEYLIFSCTDVQLWLQAPYFHFRNQIISLTMAICSRSTLSIYVYIKQQLKKQNYPNYYCQRAFDNSELFKS